MKSIAVLFGLLLSAPALAGGALKLKKVLPEPVEKVRLGDTLETVKGKVPALAKFRTPEGGLKQVWKFEFSEGNLQSVIFYFDEDLPENPLYEVLFDFKDPETADLLAYERLGPPNYNVDEWRMPLKGADWELAVWSHQGKLIYAAQMPGTEWANGID